MVKRNQFIEHGSSQAFPPPQANTFIRRNVANDGWDLVDANTVAQNLSNVLSVGNTTDGYDIEVTDGDAILFGSVPATDGEIRFSNNNSVNFRNAANTDNINVIRVNTDDIILLGNDATGSALHLRSPANTLIYGSGTRRATFASGGLDLNIGAITFSQPVSNPNIRQVDETGSSVNGDRLTLQSQNATGTTSIGGIIRVQSGTGTTREGDVEFYGGATERLRYDAANGIWVFGAPVSFSLAYLEFGTDPATAGEIRVSQGFSLQGRNGAGTANLNILRYGVTATDRLLVGDESNERTQVHGGALVELLVGGTSRVQTFGGSLRFNLPQLRWETDVLNPLLFQNNETGNGVNGDRLTVQAQNATGTSTVGGPVQLRSGTGTTREGNIEFFGGATERLRWDSSTSPSRWVFSNSDIDLGTGHFRHTGGGTGVAGTGDFRTSYGWTWNARNQANNADATVLHWGSGTTANNITLGDSTNTSRVRFLASEQVDAFVGGTRRTSTLSSAFRLEDGIAHIIGVTNVATAGDLRARHGFNFRARNNANTQNPYLLRWGVVNTDYLTLGDGSFVSRTQLNALTEIHLLVADNPILVGQATQILPLTTVAFGSQVATFGSTPATTGNIRVSDGFTIHGRNDADSQNAALVRWGVVNTDYLTIGDGSWVSNTQLDALTEIQLLIADSPKLVIQNAAIIPLTTTTFGAQVATFGSAPATTGNIRVSHGFGLYGLNNAGSANAALFRWGAATNDIIIGENTNVSKVEYRVALSGEHTFYTNNVQRVQLLSTDVHVLVNNIRFGSGVTPQILQSDVSTAATNGQPLTIRAQNATGTTSVGGDLLLRSGTGTTNAGDIALTTGNVNRLVFDAATQQVNFGFDNDGVGDFLVFDPLATDGLEIIFQGNTGASEDRNVIIKQEDDIGNELVQVTLRLQASEGVTAGANGGNLELFAGESGGGGGGGDGGSVTIKAGAGGIGESDGVGGSITLTAGNSAATSGAGPITLNAGNAVSGTLIHGAALNLNAGDTSGSNASSLGGDVNINGGDSTNGIGGNILLTPGTGGATNGVVRIAGNGDLQLVNGSIRFLSGATSPSIFQSDQSAGSTNGQSLTVRAQNATGVTSVGGAVRIQSGSGTTRSGDLEFFTGATQQLKYNEQLDRWEFVRASFEMSMGRLRFTGGNGGAIATTGDWRSQHGFNWFARNNANSANVELMSFGSAGTDDARFGSSATDDTILDSGATTRLSVAGSSRMRLTTSLIAYNLATVQWEIAVTNPALIQADQTTGSTNGQRLTVRAQNATGATSVGGPIRMQSGTGTTRAGDIELYSGATERLRYAADTGRWEFNGSVVLGTSPFLHTGGGAGIAGAGDFRTSHSWTWNARNQANDNNRNLLRWGVVANDRLDIGDTSNSRTQIQGATVGLSASGNERVVATNDDVTITSGANDDIIFQEEGGTERFRVDGGDNAVKIADATSFCWAPTLATNTVISGGVISVSRSGIINIAGQGGVADDLDTINGGIDGMVIFLRNAGSVGTVTVTESGNIRVPGTSINLSTTGLLMLIYNGQLSQWLSLL